MKEFDLEKAKAGHPLCTRDGKEVEIFKWDAKSSLPIFGMIKERIEDKHCAWRENGRWWSDGREDSNDLMLAPKKVVKWHNIYKSKLTGTYVSSIFYETELGARTAPFNLNDFEYITTKKVEWEEEQ